MQCSEARLLRLLPLKHLFLFAAPFYFVFLLRGHVLAPPDGGRGVLGRAAFFASDFALSASRFFASSLAAFARASASFC